MAALVALFVNVFLRYVFNYALNWSEELVREVIQYMTFIGCGAAIKANQQIRIDALVQAFPNLKKPLTYFYYATMVLFSLFVIYYGWKAVAQMTQIGQRTIIMGVPYKYLYLMLPSMGFLMLVRTIQAFWEQVTGRQIFAR
jgi:TRAP-type C4-dicarboxylate transport system permease small subunit